jgi:hypothetical protein
MLTTFKRFGELLASLSVVILIMGIIRQLVYYTGFHVLIKYFMSLSEIGLIVSEDLILFSIIFGGFLLLIGLGNQKKMDWETEKKLHEERERNYANLPIKQQRSIQRLTIIEITCFIALLSAGIMVWNKSTDYIFKCVGVFLIIIQVAYLVTVFGKHLIYRYLSRSLFISLSVLVLMIGGIILNTAIEVSNVAKGKFLGTTIVTNDTTYISDKYHYFIGKSAEYFFIYHAKDTTVSIIPTSELKSMRLKTK